MTLPRRAACLSGVMLLLLGGAVAACADNQPFVEPPAAPPQAPTDLSSRALPGRSVRLRWRDQSTDEGGFLVERKRGRPEDPGEYAQVGRTRRNRTTFTDRRLMAHVDYTYRVLAINAAGASEPSDTLTVHYHGR